MSGNFATPGALLGIIDDTIESYRLFALNAHDLPPWRADVILESPFVGPAQRGVPTLEYIPMRLSLVPLLLRTTRPPDVVLLHTSVPRAGKVSLGIEVNVLPAAVTAARRRGALVVAQVNPAMPYTFGDGELSMEHIDVGVEVESALPTTPPHRSSDVASEIATRVARLVGDGATLQAGIGAIPDAVLASLGEHRNLAVWSEMVSDGILRLERGGSLRPDHPITASFLFGSAELYAWADRNPRLRLLRTETVNDPRRIAGNPRMTSVNTAMQFDLFGQANASYVRGRIHSGLGGQPDFVEGSLHSPGGHAIIALASWHAKSQESTILPLLSSPATSFQHTIVVTEQGMAEIFGRSQKAQVRLLIEETAAPTARDALWESALDRVPDPPASQREAPDLAR